MGAVRRDLAADGDVMSRTRVKYVTNVANRGGVLTITVTLVVVVAEAHSNQVVTKDRKSHRGVLGWIL